MPAVGQRVAEDVEPVTLDYHFFAAAAVQTDRNSAKSGQRISEALYIWNCLPAVPLQPVALFAGDPPSAVSSVQQNLRCGRSDL